MLQSPNFGHMIPSTIQFELLIKLCHSQKIWRHNRYFEISLLQQALEKAILLTSSKLKSCLLKNL